MDEYFASAKFALTLSRKPQFFIVTLIIPTVLLTIVALGSFWLPPECGEKASLGITVFLAFNVLRMIATQHIPVDSDATPKIGTVKPR